MPFFENRGAKIYYEDSGSGEPVIAVHGLIESTGYWNVPGFAAAIEKKYRFISMDMRGHGKTTVDLANPGYDAETVGEDIIALADHLALDRFHLITHSTGGFAASRYAMRDCTRFASLILTDTASYTSVVPGDPETIKTFHHRFARGFEKFSWDEIFANLEKVPGPFFRGIMESPEKKKLLDMARRMIEVNDRDWVAAFIRSFYRDPDPMVEGLRRITCPVLVVYGDKDDLFIQSSELMAREIPGAAAVCYSGAGHFTAIEATESLTTDVLAFLEKHPLSN